MTTRPLAALVALALLLAACDSDRQAISRADLPELPAAAQHVIVLDDDGFDVARLDVLTTDLVEFRVEGDEPRGIQTDDRSIATGLLLPGESTFVVFDEESVHELSDSSDRAHVLEITAAAPETPGTSD